MIRVYGERSSGTNYLTHLLEKNFNIKVENFDNIGELVNMDISLIKYWKHEVPINKPNKDIIDIFIIRKLEPWLVSFYNNQWNLEPQSDFKRFLTTSLKPLTLNSDKNIKRNTLEIQFDKLTNEIVNKSDNGKTIFNLRYYKFNKILNYINKNSKCSIVQLDYIQTDENCKIFLESLNSKYNLVENLNFQNIYKYKGYGDIKKSNDKMNIDKYKLLINSKSNKNIETKINNLTFLIK